MEFIYKTETFEIKEEHLKLLQNFWVGWASCEYGAPAIDCKRPYGTSAPEIDIAEILGWEFNEDHELTQEQEEKTHTIHKETQIVLQICLQLQKFETGVYQMKHKYSNKWVKIN